MPVLSHASIVDLPNELLDYILSFAPADVLLKLARLCRHLNNVCLVHYLQRSGIRSQARITLKFLISQVGDDILIGDSTQENAYQDLTILSALRIAFSLRRVSVLTCKIERSHRGLIPNRLVQILNRLYNLVERLDYIDSIQLSILDTKYDDTWSRRPVLQGNGASQLSEAREWAITYRRLLGTLMKKFPQVELSHGTMPFHVHQLDTLSSSPVSASSYGKVLSRKQPPLHTPFKISGTDLDWEFRWVDERGRIVTEMDARAYFPAINSDLEVKTLTLSGTLMLLPPCVNWFPSFFKHSRLNSLTLSSINLAANLWDAVIPIIFPPLTQLQDFKIRNCPGLASSSLLKLLRYLSWTKLQSLEIGPEATDAPTASSFAQSTSFSHLLHLAAPSRWAFYILGVCEDDVKAYLISSNGQQSNSQPGFVEPHFLPSLVSLTILWHTDNTSYNSFLAGTLPIIALIHATLKLRRPNFKHLGFRSFKYEEHGKIGLECKDLYPYRGTSVQAVEMVGFDVFDVVQLQYLSASELLRDTQIVQQWLRNFGSLKVLELVDVSAQLDPAGRVGDDTERANLFLRVKEVLSVMYKEHVDLVVDRFLV